LPGWQKFFSETKSKNFEIVSVAEDISGMKAAGPWIEKAAPEFTVLIDERHTVSSLYGMVNVPTAVWIDERGKIVRPNEVAFIDNRFKSMHGIDSAPYLDGLRDWLDKGEKSSYVMSPVKLREHLSQFTPEVLLADANFKMGQYLVTTAHERDAIAYFKTAQKLRPDDWNYKRQAWLYADPDKDYGTNFMKEVKALNGKPYYPKPDLPTDLSPSPHPPESKRP
jgi:hypothetical protein